VSADAVVAALRAAQRVTAFCHENPDADTLGSAIALRLAAERLGKPAEVVSSDPPPAALAFLPRIDEVRREPTLEPDVAVVVDAGELSRIGAVAQTHADWLARATVLNLDHHVSNPRFGAVALVDPSAAATCEMVALLLPELGVPIDAEIATALLAGIVQDTHTFAHPNATPRTLRIAADLVAAGASLHAINRAIYADKPFASLALWGLMLAGMEQRCEGRIVYAALTLAMLQETGADPAASEGFVDLLGGTKAAEITVLFKEADAGRTRVSVRTRDPADAVRITSVFGGGGHARAAGCTIDAPIAEAEKRLLAECERELDRLDAGRR
jgi:phosphoesterase RecJ-like protein